MITIGLGKKEGAVACHSAVNKREGVKGLFEYLPLMAMAKLKEGNIIAALGLVRSQPLPSIRAQNPEADGVSCVFLQVENAYDETRFVKALHAADIPEGEKPLLELARQVETPQTSGFCAGRRNGNAGWRIC